MGSPQPNPSPAENGSGLVAVSASQDFEVAPAQPKLDVGIRYGGCCGIHPVSNKMFWFYHPEGAFRKIWDGIQSVLLIYIAVAVPVRLGFDIETEFGSFTWVTELTIDVYFWVDIVLNFRTGVYNKDGMVVHNFGTIAKDYLRGWFVIDVVSCFPAGYIAEMIDSGGGQGMGGTKGIKMLRMLRLAKMLRLGRLKRILQRYAEELQPYVKVVKLGGMLLIAGFMGHLFFVGKEKYVKPGGVIEYGWVHATWGLPNDTSGLGVMNPLPWSSERADEPESDSERVSIVDAYLMSYYWAVTTLTTIGYGDITPKTQIEMLVGIIAEAFGGFCFGMLVGSLSSAITAGNIAEQEYNNKLDMVREFLRAREVPLKQRRKVVAFYINYLERQTVFDERELLDMLPETIATPLMKEMYKSVVAPVPFLNRLPDESLSAVCLLMRPLTVLPTDFVNKEGDVSDFYIVQSGNVNVYAPAEEGDGEEPKYLSTMSRGEFFGEEEVLGLETEDSRKLSYVAHSISSVELVFIPRKAFYDTVQEFPELAQSLARYVYDRHQTRRQLAVIREQEGGNAGAAGNHHAKLSEKDLDLLQKIQMGKAQKQKTVAELMGGTPLTPAAGKTPGDGRKSPVAGAGSSAMGFEVAEMLAGVTEQQAALGTQLEAVMALLVEQGARLQRVEAALAAGPAPAFALHHLAPRP